MRESLRRVFFCFGNAVQRLRYAGDAESKERESSGTVHTLGRDSKVFRFWRPFVCSRAALPLWVETNRKFHGRCALNGVDSFPLS